MEIWIVNMLTVRKTFESFVKLESFVLMALTLFLKTQESAAGRQNQNVSCVTCPSKNLLKTNQQMPVKQTKFSETICEPSDPSHLVLNIFWTRLQRHTLEFYRRNTSKSDQKHKLMLFTPNFSTSCQFSSLSQSTVSAQGAGNNIL